MAAAERPTGRQKVEVAYHAAVALRSVDDYFAGKPQRDNTRTHIERALQSLGLGRFVQGRPAVTPAL